MMQVTPVRNQSQVNNNKYSWLSLNVSHLLQLASFILVQNLY